ncbi:MAG: effector-associated domain EAD1-containing protein [Crocosphaera sp.]
MSNQIIKTIKIFLASSSELKEDREQFEIFISDENDKYIEQGIYLKLILWEKFIDAMSATRLQDEYNNAIRKCDIVVSLFKTKVGQYTEEEVMTAYETFKENNKPLIYTYFKEAQINVSQVNLEHLQSLNDFKEKLKKLKHFYTKYNSIEDLKYKFSEQLNKLIPKLTNIEPNQYLQHQNSVSSNERIEMNQPNIPQINSVDPLKLTGPQIGQFQDVICQAYSEAEFKILLRINLDIKYDNIVQGNTYEERVFNLIEYFERNDQLRDLLETTYKNRETNKEFQRFYEAVLEEEKKKR